MITTNFKTIVFLLLSILMIQGCNLQNNQGRPNHSNTAIVDVEVNFNLGSVFSQRLASGNSRTLSQSRALANQNALGAMKIINLSDSSEQVLDWSVSFNGEQFSLTSNKTIVLDPGTYDFDFLVDIENHQYAGTSTAVEVTDADELNIEMTVQAVLGDTHITVDQVGGLPSFKLVYPADELTSLTSPKLGAIVNGDTEGELILELAPADEHGKRITEHYLSLSEGEQQLQLVLYDGNLQVGKSVEEQESINVVAGEAASINLIPLSGELVFAFNEEGGDALFSITFPNSIIQEAGSTDQLDILLKLTGEANTPDDVKLTAITDNGDGTSSVSYTHNVMQAEVINLALEFSDNTNNDLLASCLLENVSLDKSDETALCSIQLMRRAVMQGHVMATIGINVYDTSGNPIEGALVKVGDTLLGITGSGSFPEATAGYLKLNFVPDTYTLRAESSDKFGTVTNTFSALQVGNVDIFLDSDIVIPGNRPFITTWKTDNAGVTEGNQIKIGTQGEGYNYRVDWGDGSHDEGVTGDIIHTYAVPGTYTVSISGDFPRIYFERVHANAFTSDNNKLLSIDQWGDIRWQSMEQAFYDCENLTSEATDAPDLSQVYNMERMFSGTKSFNGDIGHWDVSNITSMVQLFDGASIFNQDISSWDVSGVLNMAWMFQGARKFNQYIGDWNVSNVENMEFMFNVALAFNENINNWDVSSVTTTTFMFSYARSFNQPIGSWDMSNVTDASYMFYEASSFNQDISNWNVSNIMEMSGLFSYATAFNQYIGDWNVSKVMYMGVMFSNATAFNQDIGDWNVSNVIDMGGMFDHATSFNHDIGSWNISNVKYLYGTFSHASAFDQDIGNWDVSNVTHMNKIFEGASSFNQDIGEWDVSNVTAMDGMFEGASSFNQDIGGWDVSNVVGLGMDSMFSGATSFDQNISNWNVSKVRGMEKMFYGTKLSTTNYDALLNSWSAQDVQSSAHFHGGNSQYSSAAQEARDKLINDFGWTITDGGVVQTQP